MNKKTTLILSSCLALTACSTASNLFGGKEEKEIMSGQRISVLELEKTLSPDSQISDTQKFDLPESWKNSAWPQAGGYPNHSMQNLAFSSEQPQKIWSASIGRGSTSAIPLTVQPVIVDNVIYTLDTKSKISAFDTEKGKRIWTTKVDKDDEDEAVIAGGISFAHGALYVTNGYDELLSVSPENGEILWRSRLPAPSRAAPTVIGSRAFVSTIDSRLVALDAKDGTSLWEYTGIGETTGLLGAASPAANNNIVIGVFSSGEVTALRVENGAVAWSDNLTNIKRFGGGLDGLSDIKAMPIIDSGTVISISFGGKIAAIEERSGTRIWDREIGGSQTPWISENLLFLVSSNNELIAMNARTGAIFWIEQLQRFEDEKDREDNIQWNGPVLANGRLILTSSHGYMMEVSPHNGKEIRTTRTKGDTRIAPIVANETLYVLSDNGTLTAYR